MLDINRMSGWIKARIEIATPFSARGGSMARNDIPFLSKCIIRKYVL
jgi:hypothetical protein